MDGVLYKISQDKKFASIGKTEQEAEWYLIEPHVEKFVHSIPAGTAVGVKSEKKDNKNHLVYIIEKSKSKFNKPQSGPTEPVEPSNTEPASSPVPPEPPTPLPATPVPPQKKTNTPPIEVNTNLPNSLKRIEIGNMTSRSLVALQGQISPQDIKGVISDLYAHYQSLVG